MHLEEYKNELVWQSSQFHFLTIFLDPTFREFSKCFVLFTFLLDILNKLILKESDF